MKYFKVRGRFKMPNKWHVKPIYVSVFAFTCVEATERCGFDLKFCYLKPIKFSGYLVLRLEKNYIFAGI